MSQQAELGAYILGTHQEEMQRLARQHEAWSEQQQAICEWAPTEAGFTGDGPWLWPGADQL
ncbi:MAG: hypothetical protein ACI9F9_001905 [Candidatus Paceibacteria bacterium]|jgi:hypothetical protein